MELKVTLLAFLYDLLENLSKVKSLGNLYRVLLSNAIQAVEELERDRDNNAAKLSELEADLSEARQSKDRYVSLLVDVWQERGWLNSWQDELYAKHGVTMQPGDFRTVIVLLASGRLTEARQALRERSTGCDGIVYEVRDWLHVKVDAKLQPQ